MLERETDRYRDRDSVRSCESEIQCMLDRETDRYRERGRKYE